MADHSLTNDELRSVLDAIAPFVWTDDGERLSGIVPAALVAMTPAHVEVSAALPDEIGELVLLNTLLALRIDWQIAGQWLTHVFVSAERSHRTEYTAYNYARGVSFKYHRPTKRATLSITRR